MRIRAARDFQLPCSFVGFLRRFLVRLQFGDAGLQHQAGGIALPHNREVINVVARQYKLDDKEGVDNPVGSTGYRLEVEATVVTGASSNILNLTNCILFGNFGTPPVPAMRSLTSGPSRMATYATRLFSSRSWKTRRSCLMSRWTDTTMHRPACGNRG